MTPPPIDLALIRSSSFVRDVEWHVEIPSTNDRGNELARQADLATPTLILTGRQTAGRGRGANRWWSDRGSLTFSLVLDPCGDLTAWGAAALEAQHWPRVALVAGVALCDLLEVLVPHVPCMLKWPNDVLLCGKKVSGILVEVPPVAASVPRRLVLGMGVNVNNSLAGAPSEIQSVAVSLRDVLEAELDSTRLLIDWLNRFDERLRALSAGEPDLPNRWQSLCALNGKTIELQSGHRTVHGACRGIDVDGALLVDTPSGLERLYAGVLVSVV